jgi:hypothetical protein
MSDHPRGEQTIELRSSSTGSATQFFTSWFCPYAQRVWIALEEKGIEYHYTEARIPHHCKCVHRPLGLVPHVQINPYANAADGSCTKTPLSLDEKRQRTDPANNRSTGASISRSAQALAS